MPSSLMQLKIVSKCWSQNPLDTLPKKPIITDDVLKGKQWQLEVCMCVILPQIMH